MNALLTRRVFAGGGAAMLAHAAGTKLEKAGGPRFFVAALTALNQRGIPDDAMAKDYLAHLAANGADGVLVLGTTGEFPSFSVRERRQIVESYARHRGRLALMVQVGAPNLPDTLQLLAHATAAGAESALVAPPFYFKNVSTEGLVHFFQPVLEAARIPILLYNIPQLTGVPITFDLLRRLSSNPNLYGIKDSFSKADVMTTTIREFPRLQILTGVPGNIAANLEAGGAGAITGNGSAFTQETSAIFSAFRSHGDVAAAQARLNERAKVIAGYDGIAAQKFALDAGRRPGDALPAAACGPDCGAEESAARKAGVVGLLADGFSGLRGANPGQDQLEITRRAWIQPEFVGCVFEFKYQGMGSHGGPRPGPDQTVYAGDARQSLAELAIDAILQPCRPGILKETLGYAP